MNTFAIILDPTHYKGFLGETVEADGKFLVKIKNTTDILLSDYVTADRIQSTFEELVEEYLDTCAEIDKQPVRT